MKRGAGPADFVLRFSEECDLALPETRFRLVEYLAAGVGLPAALRLESAVYADRLGSRAPYLARMRCLVYNLETNPRLRAIDPEALAVMSDEHMRHGTVLEDIERAATQRQAHFEAMLQRRSVSVESERSIMRCRKCHKTHLSFEQKQVRGADESMTVFVSCKDCGTNWKL